MSRHLYEKSDCLCPPRWLLFVSIFTFVDDNGRLVKDAKSWSSGVPKPTNEDPDVVETAVDWLYHGTLPKLDNETKKLDYNIYLLFCKFSEVRMMYDMKNKVMDVIRQDYARNQYIVSASVVKDVYNLDLHCI